MASVDPNETYSFSIKKIELTEKSLSVVKTAKKNEDFDFDISLKIGNNVELKECIYNMQVSISDKKTKQNLGSIGLTCFFNIPQYEQYLSGSNENGPFQEAFHYLLNAVVTGTMRGVMFSEFRGTILQNAYLPIVDPRQFEKST